MPIEYKVKTSHIPEIDDDVLIGTCVPSYPRFSFYWDINPVHLMGIDVNELVIVDEYGKEMYFDDFKQILLRCDLQTVAVP
jgi:hypothetical protein